MSGAATVEYGAEDSTGGCTNHEEEGVAHTDGQIECKDCHSLFTPKTEWEKHNQMHEDSSYCHSVGSAWFKECKQLREQNEALRLDVIRLEVALIEARRLPKPVLDAAVQMAERLAVMQQSLDTQADKILSLVTEINSLKELKNNPKNS